MASKSSSNDDDLKPAAEPKSAPQSALRDFEVPELSAITAGTWPSPIDGFRAAVAGVPLVGLIPVGDEKTAYPTGTQLGAGKKFWLRNGYYLSATPT
jgi:hypothetical protein